MLITRIFNLNYNSNSNNKMAEIDDDEKTVEEIA